MLVSESSSIRMSVADLAALATVCPVPLSVLAKIAVLRRFASCGTSIRGHRNGVTVRSAIMRLRPSTMYLVEVLLQ